ncbi:hypothetical protein MTY66_64000 (plasmid) [Mycolicibacterium sp. TY66]|uniref:hypothetical protein n=1 Tax=unclassified Mycolicibacterium TaxID=2636767 RepID=UPI001BB3348E|nr:MULTISPECIES: hypothetical protein [unclassified Mycolicibacterium]BCI84775.1 hypothetical protein MTY66_64000 [Mycolicibacterium sp. TY66]BCJ84989.1 hypothetical protein MTY81_63620 [Mycolicibacterium sp. TY81]
MNSTEPTSALRSPQWWVGMILGVISTLTVATLIFFTVPYLLIFVLIWPLLFTMATMALDRPSLTKGAFSSLFVVLVIAVVSLGVSLL